MVLLYPFPASPSRNHTPLVIFWEAISCANPLQPKQIINATRNKPCHPPKTPALTSSPVQKPKEPRICAALVVNDDKTLAIAATTMLPAAGTRTRPASAAATSSTRPSLLSTRSIRPLATGSHRNLRSAISPVEVWLVRRLVAVVIEIVSSPHRHHPNPGSELARHRLQRVRYPFQSVPVPAGQASRAALAKPPSSKA